ncbi:MAG TPA: RHS repeat-associated core domain-containing protein [Thermoanaerobaculia bacterium]|nr:RHS repeat-associated core domain-containing protein [Thermoanaerobaculia bacterium]
MLGGTVDAWGFANSVFAAGPFVYVPGLNDTGGRYVLPVIVGERFEVVQRDVAAGWVLNRRQIEPIASDQGIVEAPIPEDEHPARPMLIDARPFHFIRFAAPPADTTLAVRLEVEAKGVEGGKVQLQPIADYPLPEGTSLEVFDLSHAARPANDPDYGAPEAGPRTVVCSEGQWSLAELKASSEMLLVLSPGDLDTTGQPIELQFDRALDKLPANTTVAKLSDLGPKAGCRDTSGAGYPQAIPVDVDLGSQGTRLVITPQGPLPAGHRFRLELTTSALRTPAGEEAWPTPSRFEFATRAAAHEGFGDLPGQAPLGPDSPQANDILQIGHLMFVGADNGELMAFDVSGSTEAQGFRRQSRLAKTLESSVRTLTTDSHGRVFWTGLYGSLWAVKALRIEDVQNATTNTCGDSPDWAAGIPCFPAQEGSVRIAFSPGSTSVSASEWLSSLMLPSGTPMDLDVLVQDEEGAKLGLEEFLSKYGGGSLSSMTPDAGGAYTFNVTLNSTQWRATQNKSEPSRPGTAPVPGFEAWRTDACDGEELWDRYQRVSVDNLTTGQRWSFDIENEWPEGSGNGTATLSGIKARRGDRLQVRYNLRTLGYVAIMGSGITVVDLNRAYRVASPGGFVGDRASGRQCGRRLGQFEGEQLEFPACTRDFGAGPEGISLTPSLAVQSATGSCPGAGCRGAGMLDSYSPLSQVGAVHARTADDHPAGFGQATASGEPLQAAEVAACIRTVANERALLRDIATGDDVDWFDYHLRGNYGGTFIDTQPGKLPEAKRGDLLFLTLGAAGVFVFDVSDRVLDQNVIVGLLRVKDHTAFRVQVDHATGLLFVGGTDSSGGTSKPVVDVWDLRYVAGAPGSKFAPRPLASLPAPWATGHLGLEAAASGLLYAWDRQHAKPQAMPFDRPQFVFGGLYRPFGITGDHIEPISRPATSFVPLGVAMELKPEDERNQRELHEREASAAFKVRISLPGSLGPLLQARVQSLVTLPSEHLLGRKDVGAAEAVPGGPGWPDPAVTVTLRRVSSERTSGAFDLYESDETVLLVADPRARREYHRQDVPGSDADEEGQCRRCAWPGYLPDPAVPGPARDRVKELLAGGPYVRVLLFEDEHGDASARAATHQAIDFFKARGDDYPLPFGTAELRGFADAVPSPVQAALVEPAQGAAVWPGVAGVMVSLTGGEALLAAVDHEVAGRVLPVTFGRSYRSHTLGYGPLGSAGWSSSLFAHLREIPTTGEVELRDGSGRVLRFLAKDKQCKVEPPLPTHQRDDGGCSYFPPKGTYLRLLRTGFGWRLLDRNHNEQRFDRAGRIFEASDRLRQGGEANRIGSTMRYLYDAFGRLVTIEDDLGRLYRLEYYDNPRPENETDEQGHRGDGPRYGLLKKVTDFADRTVEYQYDEEDRLLQQVRLPEVTNPHFAELNFTGATRPTIEYRYAPSEGVGRDSQAAVLHGDFAALRLGAVVLPSYLPGGNTPERIKLGYDAATGRIKTLTEPEVSPWRLAFPAQSGNSAPATEIEVTSPWNHPVTFKLADGRLTEQHEMLPVTGSDGQPTQEQATTAFSYTDDGRSASITYADGGVDFWCYADGAPTGAAGTCPAGGETDLLKLANATRAGRRAGSSDGSSGPAELAVSVLEYDTDNLPKKTRDGLQRTTQLPVPNVAPETRTGTGRFEVGYPEASRVVAFDYKFDAHGRPTSRKGIGEAPPEWTGHYGSDEKNREGAGFLEEAQQGSLSTKLTYDNRGNVKRQESSWGTSDVFEYDEWDRPVHEETSIAGGAFAAPGGCGSGGVTTWRGFDAAGHLVAEKHLQDYVVDAGGGISCREVETKYEYDARENVVKVEQSHLASPSGEVDAGLREVARYGYSPKGQLEHLIRKNGVYADLVTTLSYDNAGRVSSEQTGGSGARLLGYDAKGRLSYRTDGDKGKVSITYDAWDRPSREQLPTGALVEREWDAAGGLRTEKVTDSTSSSLLAKTETTFTAFGALSDSRESLSQSTNSQGEVTETVRKTAYHYDESGRLVEVWAGTGDTAIERKLAIYSYEPGTGRLLSEGGGGAVTTSQPLFEQRYTYDGSPWPSAVQESEVVPGGGLVPTLLHTIVERDSLGRVILQTASDGSALLSQYDRTGGAISWQTGAGTRSSVVLDAVGKVVREIRPAGRGETRYGYDVDGRLLAEGRASTNGGWVTNYGYDTAGRLTAIQHADGSVEGWTYDPDDVPATWTTRDGVPVRYDRDAANRVLARVVGFEPPPPPPPPPTPPPPPVVVLGAASPAPPPSARLTQPSQHGAPQSQAFAASGLVVDGGDHFEYDALSRLTVAERSRPDQRVKLEGWDLAGRPGREIVGAREPITRSYDTFDNPLTTQLPGGPVRSAGGVTGWTRGFDTLDRQSTVSPLGGPAHASGASWQWSGARLYRLTNVGGIGTQAQFGYHGGPGPSSPAAESSAWHLGAVQWAAGSGSTWGTFGIGWRQADGVKTSRPTVGDAFGSMGWSYGYDAGVRLASASSSADSWGFSYGVGDERQVESRSKTGEVAQFVAGADGRIASRNSVVFTYDTSGRRASDDRFDYGWDWRGQLVSVTVKESWPDADGDGVADHSPYAGHQVRYTYDALGRLLLKEHVGKRPVNGTDADRPFIELRELVWDGDGLATEIAYGAADKTQPRWRTTRVPGPDGLDDAPQVLVEVEQSLPGNVYAGTTHTYSYVRDEMGSVVGVVGEDEQPPAAGKPPMAVRYLYTPYGAAHAETGPELRREHLDNDVTTAGGVSQLVTDLHAAAPGAMVLDWSIALDVSSLADGVAVERLAGSGQWIALGASEVVIALREDADHQPQMLAMTTQGWLAGTTYRVRLQPGLRDALGRPFGTTTTIEWQVPSAPPDDDVPPTRFDKKIPVRFDGSEAAGNTLGDRFPGGQNALFQGAYVDRVTGLTYLRNRWLDTQTGAFLSEDPIGSVDSPSLYAFVGHAPNMGVDPLGLREATAADQAAIAGLQARIDRFDYMYGNKGVAGTTLIVPVAVPGPWYDPSDETVVGRPQSFLADDAASYRQLRARLQWDRNSYVAAVDEADAGGEIEYDPVAGKYYTYTEEERVLDRQFAAVGQMGAIAMDLATAAVALGPRSGAPMGPQPEMVRNARLEPLAVRGTPQAGQSAQAIRVQANKASGDAFSRAVGSELQATHEVAVPEITVRTQSGFRTRLDWVTKDTSGTIGCVECKGSQTAPLRPGQQAAHREMAQTGAVVVGKGKPGVPGGTVIPPTAVEVRRPGQPPQ